MPEYTITVDIPEEEVADLKAQAKLSPSSANPDRYARASSKASARLRAALLEAATPPPVTSITLGMWPFSADFSISDDDDDPRLVVMIDGQAVLVPFDDVIDAVTQLRDTAKEMQA